MDGNLPKRSSEKVISLEELSAILDTARDYRKLVLCHGAFDLLHIGHLRHLITARKFGDLLVATITADEYIRKGPDRPVFTAAQRAEMLAALEIVDYVSIVDGLSATPAIEAVKPHYYVKGGEYENAEDDITGKILAEGELVKRLGGELVFTHEMTFSSSSLLNRHFGAINGSARAYFDQKHDSGLADRVGKYLDKIADMRVVVVGETIIDRYV